SDADADRRIVDGRLAVRAVIVDRVTELEERLLQMFFEEKTSVVCAYRHSHGQELYYDVLDSDRHDFGARRGTPAIWSPVDLQIGRQGCCGVGRRSRCRAERSRRETAWHGVLQRSIADRIADAHTWRRGRGRRIDSETHP